VDHDDLEAARVIGREDAASLIVGSVWTSHYSSLTDFAGAAASFEELDDNNS